MKYYTLSLFLLLIFHNYRSFGQTSVFSYTDFIELVKSNHPLALAANLKEAQADALVQKAKGGFDPKVEGDATQKYYDGSQYYSHLHAGLKVPTWFGLTVQGGYNLTDGTRLNPEAYSPTQGIWSVGITANLGNGLLIDQRRAELQQADIYKISTLNEQKLMINQLLFDATINYWEWFKAYNKVVVYNTAKNTAKMRFEAIRESAMIGDLPYVDTLKAIILFQDQSLKLEQAKLELANKQQQLEIFLWSDGFVPLEIDTATHPVLYSDKRQSVGQILPKDSLNSFVQNHPEMIQYQNKIDLAKIDFRMYKENLKPTLQLKYNLLNAPINQDLIGGYTIENYAWGANFSYPIFTRKERANVELSELKIQEAQYELADKSAQLNYKIQAASNAWISSSVQVDIYKETVKNYERLFQAEYDLFNEGESSLFLVNLRDQEQISAQIKLIELLYENQIYEALVNYQLVRF